MLLFLNTDIQLEKMHTYSLDIMQLVTGIIYAFHGAVHVDKFVCHHVSLQMPKIPHMNIRFLIVYFLYGHQDGTQSGKTICHQNIM
jgi:hypothetical protein